jgi:hypothetical protein
MVETTAEHFATFREEVTELWGELGITSWDLVVIHGTPQDDERYQHAAGGCGFLPDQRRVLISLSRQVSYADIPRLKLIATHEVAHAFLAPLENAARDRFVTEEQVDSTSHEVVHRLVALFGRLVA